ncbi:MAG: ABC transporter ATP-binding protein, partial [Planctomycetes bacterium]|nr:ABC transporter ATP-binding protein [Planctomycetota bacterium]
MSRAKKNESQIKRLIKLLKPYRGLLVEGGAYMLLGSFLALPIPLLTMYIIDHVFPTGRLSLLHLLCCGAFTIVLLQIAAGFTQSCVLENFKLRVISDMQKKLYRHVQSLPLEFFQQRQTGYIMARIREDVRAAQGLFASVILGFIHNLITFALGLLLVFFIHWKMALLACLFLPFFVVSNLVFQKKL